MTQIQEGEQQEPAKKPDGKQLWRAFYWFTSMSACLISFFVVWLTVDSYDRGDWWQAFLFVLVGSGFYLLLCLWRPMKVRVIGILGCLLWSVVAWSIGYIQAAANLQNTSSRVGPFVYQLGVIYGTSVPFVLLFFAFIFFVNRHDFIGK